MRQLYDLEVAVWQSGKSTVHHYYNRVSVDTNINVTYPASPNTSVLTWSTPCSNPANLPLYYSSSSCSIFDVFNQSCCIYCTAIYKTMCEFGKTQFTLMFELAFGRTFLNGLLGNIRVLMNKLHFCILQSLCPRPRLYCTPTTSRWALTWRRTRIAHTRMSARLPMYSTARTCAIR
jgi:hypothetical protein